MMGLEGHKVWYVTLFYDLRIAGRQFIHKKLFKLRHKNIWELKTIKDNIVFFY